MPWVRELLGKLDERVGERLVALPEDDQGL
jgi:hypothetical protein